MRGIVVLIVFCSNIAFAQLKFDRNVPENIRSQILQDLNYIYEIKLSKASSLHRKIFQDQSYKDFFNSRVFTVGVDLNPNNIATAYVNWLFPNKMFLGLNYVQHNHPLLMRVEVLFHEARHTEKERWSHVNCPVPFLDEDGSDMKGEVTGIKLEGLPACDTHALGAYGLGSVMLRNIALYCENCSEKIKMDAEIFSEFSAKRIITPNEKLRLKKDK
jgi:hypothetical protein